MIESFFAILFGALQEVAGDRTVGETGKQKLQSIGGRKGSIEIIEGSS
jgi:hypothetical protein